MISLQPIHTGRLELIPATLDILKSDLGNRDRLAGLLHAEIPASWPPPMLTPDVLKEFIRLKYEGADPLCITWYWIRDEGNPENRVLIGSGGIATLPVAKNGVFIGYSVLSEFQNRGYATEAVRAIVSVIFAVPNLRRILATTNPNLPASIRVLEKTGFIRSGTISGGTGFDEGTILYVREREEPSVRLREA
ncbi:MAG: GNAT family N-acetyltransferase [Methanoregulaceae archaeon]